MSRSGDVNVDEVVGGHQQENPEPPGNDTFEDELGGFNEKRKAGPRGMKGFLVLLTIVALTLIGFIAWQIIDRTTAGNESASSSLNTRPAMDSNFRLPSKPPEPAPSPQIEPTQTATSTEPQAPTPASVTPAGSGRTNRNGEPELTPEEKAMQRRLSAFDSNSAPRTDDGMETVNPAGSQQPGEQSESSQAFFKDLNSGSVERVMASRLEHPSLTVPQGTMIHCGTTTELDTTVAGMVGCLVSRPVLSADGKVRLIDRGAHVTGFIGRGIQHGEARVFVAWNRLRNPDQTIVNLDSPGTSSLGSPGIKGHVNSHFWARFGGAMAVSVISDIGNAGVQAAANAASDGNTNINLNTTSQSSQQLAEEVLKRSLDIPPTLSAPQGSAVAIYLAKDLDFSSVYTLQLAE